MDRTITDYIITDYTVKVKENETLDIYLDRTITDYIITDYTVKVKENETLDIYLDRTRLLKANYIAVY